MQIILFLDTVKCSGCGQADQRNGLEKDQNGFFCRECRGKQCPTVLVQQAEPFQRVIY